MDVSAVLVTRGDVDLEPIIATFPPRWDLVVWDNSRRRDDLSVYGRYAALAECEHDVVYVQDDDCVTDPEQVVAAYEPGRLVANMPEVFRPRYPDSCLVGFGAVFDRDLPERALERLSIRHESFANLVGEHVTDLYVWPYGFDRDTVLRTCDVVFTGLTPRTLIDVPYRNLPHAYSHDRMYRQASHVRERNRMLRLVRRVRQSTVAA